MLVIPGDQGKVTCDGITRRELMRVGGSALLGLSLPQILQLRAASAAESVGGVAEFLNDANQVLIFSPCFIIFDLSIF